MPRVKAHLEAPSKDHRHTSSRNAQRRADATLKPRMSYELPKAYDPSVIEERWAEYWVHEKLFEVVSPVAPKGAQGDATKFTMLLPPPNVTGFLHMGHMFEHAESDIMVRWHRMC